VEECSHDLELLVVPAEGSGSKQMEHAQLGQPRTMHMVREEGATVGGQGILADELE